MKDCYIFCAGRWNGAVVSVPEEALLIAADGGLRHTQALGLRPGIILGDFDSLGYVPDGAQVHPVEKDDTDAMLAARVGLQQGYDRFFFLASLDGDRLDHTVANFQTLAFLLEQGAWGCLVGNHQMAALLSEGTWRFPQDCRGDISLLSWGEEAAGVTIEGLYYNLNRGRLTNHFPLGVSNRFTGKESRIIIEEGKLLAIWSRNPGLPEKG